MKTTNYALVTDSGGKTTRTECDFLMYAGESVLLMEDFRSETSNRTEVVAYFYRPARVELMHKDKLTDQ